MQRLSIHRHESRILLILPMTLYLSLCVLYLFAIPPGESPDEPSHLQCIEQVSILNRIPIVDPPPHGLWWTRERVISGLTCYHLPLYYFVAGYTQKMLALTTGTSLHYEFPPADPDFATGASVAMFAHGSKSGFWVLTEPFTLTALRIESILFGLVTLWTAYRIARRLVPTAPYAPLFAVTLVAGWPQFVFMSRAINNDMLAFALAGATLAILVGSDHPRRYIAANVLIVAAVLSKTTMVFTAGVAALSWVIEWFTASGKARRIQLTRFGLISILLFGALVAFLILQPTLREHVQATATTITPPNPASQTATYWGNVFRTTLQSGWGRFGWMNLATPDSQVYTWWALLAITVPIGFISATCRSHKAINRHVILICSAWIICTLVVYSRIQLNRFQPQFRYAFAMIPVLTAFSGVGLTTLLGSSARLQRLAVLLLTALLLAVNLWIVFVVLVPAYV